MTEKLTPQQIELGYRNAAAKDFLTFVGGLKIAGAYGAVNFSSVIAPFQTEFFEALAPSLHAVRETRMPPIRRFWLERTKKGGKDSDLAAAILWLVAFSERPIYMQVGAADKDQAGIVKRRMTDLLHHNSWLKQAVKITRNKVEGRYASLDILAADIAGSHGETPDVLIINELSHVTKWDFLENLMDNADGVPQGLVTIATNAGFLGSKAAVWKSNAEQSDFWSCHYLSEPAPWITQEQLNDARERNSASRFQRLWKGKWVSGKGDAFDEQDIDLCFSYNLGPMKHWTRADWQFVLGLDLGISHDHAGLVVLGVNEKERVIRLAEMKAWEPQQSTKEIDLIDVREYTKGMYKFYRAESLWYDPYQAKLMSQELKRENIVCVERSFAGTASPTLMANSLKQAIEDHMIQLFDDGDGRLRRDIGKFSIVEKGLSGYKLDAVSDEYGHADVGTALVIALPRAIDLLEGRKGLRPEDDLDEEDETPWTDKDTEELPDELREIYEMNQDRYQRYDLDDW